MLFFLRQTLRLVVVETDPVLHSRSVFLLKLLSAELETQSYYLVNYNVRGYLSWELRPLSVQLLWLCSHNSSLSLLVLLLHSSFFPLSWSLSLLRPLSIPQPNSTLGALRRGPSALLSSHFPRKRQCPSYHLQGVSEPHLCGGQDPPTCGEMWGLQWSYGGFP